ncbi:MAG: hypothetical protein K2G44_05745 [Clostridia bacterium]|nr:hypothetical protein [Clostridia bacterium]
MRIKKKVKLIRNFIEEYNRMKPKSEEEFNMKRNKRKCKSSEYLIELFKCSDWYWLIVICELPFYLEKENESDLIEQIQVFMPDEMIGVLCSESDLRSILRTNKLI